MSTVVGIDLGDRSIGVALGDRGSHVVMPLVTLRRSTPERDATSIGRICREQTVEHIVVGLPLHLDGRDGEQAQRTRDWAAAVAPLLTVPLTFRDERLTSEQARSRMGRPPRGRSGGPPSPATLRAWRARIDREAAAAILQAEFDSQPRDRQEPSA